jgi:transporter family-2 protein
MHTIYIVFQGVVITTMIWFNAALAESVGMYLALVFTHTAGLVGITIVRVIKREKWRFKKVKPYLLTGGILGVSVVFIQNLSFNKIGASLTITATLIGQIVISFIVDIFGLFESPVIKPTARKMIPMVVIGIGFLLILWGN